MSIKQKIKKAESGVNTTPTDAQKKVGNYKKGKVTIKGFKITIENPVGSIRRGKNSKGIEWENEVKNTYGYFNGTIGKDGDHIDLYLGPLVEESFDIYIIDQVEEDTRAFDEHKVMFGFADKESSKKAYLSNFNKNWSGFGNITKMSLETFRKWIKDKTAIKYPAGKISKIDYKNILMKEESVFKTINLASVVEEGVTLKDLKQQAGDISKFDTLLLKIASPGGSVSEGLEIMTWLNNLSTQGKFIITLVTANAYSIASLIMLAANLKLVSAHSEVMVHNPMIPELKYANADTLEVHLNDLRSLEDNMYDIYNIFTQLNRETIKVLMDNETCLSPEEAVKYGFADEIINMEKVPYVEAVNIKKEINMSKTINVLNKVIAMVNNSPVVNQLYHSKDGTKSVEIFQVDPSTFSEGDKTSMSEGEIELADGAKLTIEDSVIKNIDREIKAETLKEEEAAEEEPKAEILEEEETKVEEVVGEEEIKAEAPDEKVEEAVEATLDEEVEKVKASAPNVGPSPKKIEKKEDVAVAAEKDNAVEDLTGLVKGLEKTVENLSKKLEFFDSKFEAIDKFEEKAAQTIDELAKHTSSNFKPAAKAVADVVSTGSIFKQALQASKESKKRN